MLKETAIAFDGGLNS